ncbi:MAG: phosphoribosylaminoimidazole carboxylase ade2 [Peltula sp. TS41687]|nr:MAG: phosphoribosylaminoimidazole carboxylase ade2 [Peltula sp. TS41687]
MDSRTVGVLGGGQLGRMLVEAAHRMNIKLVLLDVEGAPAKQINALHPHINGSFTDPESIRRLARECDVLTVEIEHVDTKMLQEIAEQGIEVVQGDRSHRRKVEIHPSWETIRVIQDKYLQKQYLEARGIQMAQSVSLGTNDPEELAHVVGRLGLPCMLKSKTQAYDGRGNHPIRVTGDIPSALHALANRPLYVEKWAPFTMELAVMVVKTKDETTDVDPDLWKLSTLSYPVVETIHENSICKLVYAPARNVRAEVREQAQILARRAVGGFKGKGIFGVEMFLLEDGSLLVNEIAPRPHNSGHYTIEACPVSQYDAHLRAILDLPFPPSSPTGASSSSSGTDMVVPGTHAVMLNLLGGVHPDSHMMVARQALSTAGARVHLYGKGAGRLGRKMGHITVLAGSMAEAEARINPLIEATNRARSQGENDSEHRSSGLASAREQGSSSSEHETRQTRATVAITMGSDSDLPILKPGISLLRELDIPFEVTITSAHRTPDRMSRYAQAAAGRGIKVIIAAAGGAAHLPGMLAANTPLPVIGVPVKASSLDGMDSLLSIVQMPRGVPVATVSINNSVNAALLAARILGTSDVRIKRRVEEYADQMEREVMDKVTELDRQGWDKYETLWRRFDLGNLELASNRNGRLRRKMKKSWTITALVSCSSIRYLFTG